VDQLTQNLKNGAMQLLEVPFPALQPGSVLVRNYFSVISAGTEGKSVKDARLGYIGKARARREEVGKVIKSVKTYGLFPAYRMVMNKLDAPSPLGYCCAGEVIAVASDVKDFKVGDKVACGGNTAVHAEVVCVPVNLAVLVPSSVDLREAAFATLGAIAMQGIRQADLRLGENAVVIGLGLLGQLTIQMLNAAGVKTIGIDIDSRMVKLAAENGCMLAVNRNDETLLNQIVEFTAGYGTDAVIITAGTDSTDPVDLAGELCRKKGKVIVVGAVPTGFKRANYFKKELDLRMSSSYGPGRYDREYEEEGLDYPYAYVRWTENRNMEAFVELLRSGKVSPGKMITHEFPFAKAEDAYKIIVEKTEPFTGMVLKYDLQKSLKKDVILKDNLPAGGEVSVGFIGAGSFAQNFLLPNLKGLVRFASISTARPHNAQNMAAKYGFAAAKGEAEQVAADSSVNTVFIATRHDTHARYVLSSLKNGKNVFVEKPLCLTLDELEEIRSAYAAGSSSLMLGFNRRFAPFSEKLKAGLSDGPLAISYRINAGYMPADHWVHDPSVGGGRIVGEVCHFIDYCVFLTGSKVISVSAVEMAGKNNQHDSISIQLSFANCSIASISYYSNGHKDVAKEYIEVFSSGIIGIIDDFKELKFSGRKTTVQTMKQDKGHANGVRLFIDSLKNKKAAPVSFDEIYHSTYITFCVLESIATGQVIHIK
jgi:polar amino acid transport system substrate-binding protein